MTVTYQTKADSHEDRRTQKQKCLLGFHGLLLICDPEIRARGSILNKWVTVDIPQRSRGRESVVTS